MYAGQRQVVCHIQGWVCGAVPCGASPRGPNNSLRGPAAAAVWRWCFRSAAGCACMQRPPPSPPRLLIAQH